MTDAEHLAQHLTPLDRDGVLALGDMAGGRLDRAPIFLVDRLIRYGRLEGAPRGRWKTRVPLARQQGSTYGLTTFGKKVYAALSSTRSVAGLETPQGAHDVRSEG